MRLSRIAPELVHLCEQERVLVFQLGPVEQATGPGVLGKHFAKPLEIAAVVEAAKCKSVALHEVRDLAQSHAALADVQQQIPKPAGRIEVRTAKQLRSWHWRFPEHELLPERAQFFVIGPWSGVAGIVAQAA